MSAAWYYVQGNDRIGPIDTPQLEDLFKKGTLKGESYVWRKGLSNWQLLRELSELQYLVKPPAPVKDPMDEIPALEKKEVDWQTKERIFLLKIGQDRGAPEVEYGPFTLAQIKKLFQEKRINSRTLIFTPGMDNWVFLADIPVYQSLFAVLPPKIEEVERRQQLRRPFVARVFFHDNQQVYDGICRDISIGGLQLLVADFPGKIGDEISLNVHPENSSFGFTAAGKIVRYLDGGQGLSLRFMNLADDAKKAIHLYLEKN